MHAPAPPRLRPVVIALMAAVVACGAPAEPPPESGPALDPAQLQQLEEWVAEELERPVAGLSIGVARGDEVLLARGWGLADVENDVEATADTVYRIGSITKQFTAAAIMQQVEAGNIDLDADIREYVPDFPTGDHTVTVEHLLHHTSGIKSYTGLGQEWLDTIRLDLTHDELLDLVADRPFDFAPGTEYRYNNTGYYLLGVILEEVTGRPYAEHLEESLLEPLEMDSTVYCDERRLIPHRAEGYDASDDGLLNDEMLSMRQPFAAGALCSSVTDLIAWTRALHGGEVVTAESLERMTTPATLADGSSTGYGYGLGVGELEGHRRIAHGGGINGFVSQLAHYPDDGLTVAVLVNTPSPAAERLAGRIARLMLGLEIVEIADLPLSEEEAEPYLGRYQLGELVFEVTYAEGHLQGQATNQAPTLLRYQGEHVFVPDFSDQVRLTFHVEDGRATGFTLLQGGEAEATRIEE